MLPIPIDEKIRTRVDLGESPEILIVRLSAIGDCILTMPVATALKASWPNCKLTWVVDCAASQLLEQHPCVDRVIRIPKGFLLKPKILAGLRRELQSYRFDIAIDPQGLFKSGFLTWLSGAPKRLGFDRCHAREGASAFYTERRHPLCEHLLERQLELLEMLQIEIPMDPITGHFIPDFGWDSDARDTSSVRNGMRMMGLREKQFVVINPGAGWESKRWPIDRYAVLADRIKQKSGLDSLVIWGNPREEDLAKTIVALAPGAAILAPRTDLISLSQWLRFAALFVGSDTGPMHLATAVGTTVVAMFGTTLAQKSGPFGPQHRSLQKRYDGGSSRYRRNTTNAAMQAIHVDDVLLACLERIASQTSANNTTVLRAAA